MSRAAAFFLVLGAAVSSPGWSQSTAATAAAVEAQRLQAEGRSDEAVRMLEGERGRCGEGAAGKVCRQILEYSRGYVLQQESAASADPAAALHEAAAAYANVLADSPSHGPTIDNLVTVYQNLGEPENAVPYLERALQSDGATPRMKLELGDLLLQERRVDEARALFKEVLEALPGDEAACHRLVLSYELAPDGSGAAAALLRVGKSWEKTVPAAALDAFEAAMRTAWSPDPLLAEEALVLWVRLLGRTTGLSEASLARLPAGWSSPAVTGLREWLKAPESRPADWWRSEPARSALGAATLGLGRDRLARGEPARAEAVWIMGRDLADRSEPAYTDLQTELALLYFRNPQLDPRGDKFLDVENRLYNEKLTAMVRHDLASTQRLHTALGLIYADRGIWESALRPRSALFQLDLALSDAAVRDRDEGTFQPLPWLRKRLADGYSALGRRRKAAPVYLEAARAYLDVDDLGKAAKMISAGRALAEPSWEAAAEADRLAAILATRRKLSEAAEQPATARPALSRKELRALAGSAWLAPSWSYPEPKFLDRQRFKALADLAEVEERSMASAPALSHGSQALDMALERRVYLSGAGDLLRLQRLQALSARALGTTAPEPRVVAESEPGTLPLALPSGGEPARVRVSPEGALANRIVLALGADAVVAARPELRIEKDRVYLVELRPGTDAAGVTRRIRETGGVGQVVVAPRRSPEKQKG